VTKIISIEDTGVLRGILILETGNGFITGYTE
jgi:hypothetical protein